MGIAQGTGGGGNAHEEEEEVGRGKHAGGFRRRSHSLGGNKRDKEGLTD